MLRRKFTRKFKLEVVRAYLTRDPSESQATVGARFKLGKATVSQWVAEFGNEVTRSLPRGTEVVPTPPPLKAAAPPTPVRVGMAQAEGVSVPLIALAGVVRAIETLPPEQRRTVVRAVLGLLPS